MHLPSYLVAPAAKIVAIDHQDDQPSLLNLNEFVTCARQS